MGLYKDIFKEFNRAILFTINVLNAKPFLNQYFTRKLTKILKVLDC